MGHARLLIVLGLVGVAIAQAAPSASGTPRVAAVHAQASSAGTFIRTVLHLRASRQYAKLWSKLHPAQQVFVSRGRFIACEKQMDEALGVALNLVRFQVLRTNRENIRIPGTQQTRRSINVRYRYTMRAADETIGPITDNSHAVPVNGRWTWLVAPNDAATYKAGRCRIS
jgi:type II secretory pathway pseudopilin PulG